MKKANDAKEATFGLCSTEMAANVHVLLYQCSRCCHNSGNDESIEEDVMKK